MPDIATQILDLRKLRDLAQRHRADADASLKLGDQQLRAVEEQIRAKGVNPETVDQELAALEAQLEQAVAEAKVKIEAEIAGYQQILQAAQQAGLR